MVRAQLLVNDSGTDTNQTKLTLSLMSASQTKAMTQTAQTKARASAAMTTKTTKTEPSLEGLRREQGSGSHYEN